ncbi:MAG: C-terminal binding protein, partial [Pseudomonadota bacterium]
MKILIIDPQFEGEPDVERAVTGPDADIRVWQTVSEGPVPDSEFADCEALVNCRSRNSVTPETVARMKNCKIVVQAGVGFNHIDIEACAAAGIPVCNVPDYGTSEVADHALSLALALTRGVVAYDTKLRARQMGWFAREQKTVRRLRGSRFGIIGLGRIGLATALRARAFETEIAFVDPYLPPGIEKALGFQRMESVGELLSASDIVSCHTPLTQETTGLIGNETLAEAKPGLVLVNTSRGPVVDLDAAESALRDGRLGALGLDVLPVEPLDYVHPLLGAWERGEDWL